MTPENRTYRQYFSKAYRILYTTAELGYLTEILDSAQKGFPFLWVNGEKYDFSPDVLQNGYSLFSSFMELKNFLASFAKRLEAEEIETYDELLNE